ncbi:MAG: RagB/SusD family nutrient uptake outer membrane protein [Rikenellaceae bacterium]
MKRLIYIIAACVTLQSCNYLDFDETSSVYTEEDMYDTYTRCAQMLTNVYSYIPQDFGTIDCAMRDCGSDDAEYANTAGTIQAMNNGNWSATNTLDTQWTLYYGIRAANDFIQNVVDVDFSRYEYSTNYSTWMDKLQYHVYEARVLRAHFFFELARRYGDIPMPTTALTIEQANELPKTSFEDVISFIVSECSDSAPNLPISYEVEVTGSEFGRVTQGFALAVKTKALLYAASPLHTTSDADKWKSVARAAMEVMAVNRDGVQEYSLDTDGVFNSADQTSDEIIMLRLNSQSSNFELYNFPVRFTYGNRSGSIYGVFPTQNLVETFQTTAGYSIELSEDGDWICADPNFDAQSPYALLDKRFARTVLANGDTFKDETIQLYEGGQDDNVIDAGGSATGYFLRKYIAESTSFVQNATVTNYHNWIIYRYAETLLSYAEAMNEAFSPTYTDSEFTLSALGALNLIRANAGMPNIETTKAYETSYSTQSGLRTIIQNEWRVEFAFEDHRFWDIRRWKIGNTTTEIAGIGITLNSTTGEYSYSRNIYENRIWSDKMYLYPIPQSELFANPNLAPQNSGW